MSDFHHFQQMILTFSFVRKPYLKGLFNASIA